MVKNKEVFERINSRIRKDQIKFIKGRAKKLNVSEGEMHRIIVDFYMVNEK